MVREIREARFGGGLANPKNYATYYLGFGGK
jgi:hypothetical protein